MVCKTVCPESAISIKAFDNGFKYPSIDKNKCTNCSTCINKCPVENTIYTNKKPKCYAAAAEDTIRMDRSSSGGIFGVISEWYLNNGGFVCGAIFDDKWQVKHIISKNSKDVYKMRGSKYVQSNISGVYEKIEELLKANKKVLFTGTGCQIAAIKSLLNNKYKSNIFYLEILCHGITSPELWKEYLKSNFNPKEIKNINFRSKKYGGWHNFNIEINSKGQKYNNKFLDDDYTKIFSYDFALRNSCYRCKFNKIPRQGDITIGDFWGIEKIDKQLDDNKGLSLVLINNQKGKKLINNIKCNLTILKKENLKKATVMNPNIYKPTIEPINKNTFEDIFNNITKSPNLINNYMLNKKQDAIILNYWYGNNYGASLTCYALIKSLLNNGYFGRTLNYVPPIFENTYNKSFSKPFAEKFLNLTEPCSKREDFKKLNNLTNTFIVGSDQVWNANLYKQYGGNLYQLNFANKDKKKIACAVSFGSEKFNGSNSEAYVFKALINAFNDITVRENSGKILLKNEFNINATVVPDPVFAISKEEWKELAGEKRLIKEKYIAAYIIGNEQQDTIEKWTKDSLNYLSKKTKLPVKRISFSDNESVENYVNKLQNAEIIITNSFHASCFSIIFNKPLIYVMTNNKLFTRIESLFDSFNYKPIIIDDNNFEVNIKKFIKHKQNLVSNSSVNEASKIFNKWLVRAMKAKNNISKSSGNHYDKIKNLTFERDMINLENERNKLTINQLNNRINDLQSSFSWKITKPYRFLSASFKKLIKRY